MTAAEALALVACVAWLGTFAFALALGALAQARARARVNPIPPDPHPLAPFIARGLAPEEAALAYALHLRQSAAELYDFPEVQRAASVIVREDAGAFTVTILPHPKA